MCTKTYYQKSVQLLTKSWVTKTKPINLATPKHLFMPYAWLNNLGFMTYCHFETSSIRTQKWIKLHMKSIKALDFVSIHYLYYYSQTGKRNEIFKIRFKKRNIRIQRETHKVVSSPRRRPGTQSLVQFLFYIFIHLYDNNKGWLKT